MEVKLEQILIEEEPPSASTARSRHYCCICKNHRGKVVDGRPVRLHRFPKDKKLRQVWIRRVKMVSPSFRLKNELNDRLCSAHFKDGRYDRNTNIIPSIFALSNGRSKTFGTTEMVYPEYMRRRPRKRPHVPLLETEYQDETSQMPGCKPQKQPRYDPRIYMITLCVTIEQETAIKQLYEMRGWPYPSLNGELLGISQQPKVTSCTQTYKATPGVSVSTTTRPAHVRHETPKDVKVIVPTPDLKQKIMSYVSTSSHAEGNETQRVVQAGNNGKGIEDKARVGDCQEVETSISTAVSVVPASTLTRKAKKAKSVVSRANPEVIVLVPATKSAGLQKEDPDKAGNDDTLGMECQYVGTDNTVSHKDSQSKPGVGRQKTPRKAKVTVPSPVVRQEAKSVLAPVTKTCESVQQASTSTKLLKFKSANAHPTIIKQLKQAVKTPLKTDKPAAVDHKAKTVVASQPGGRNPSAESVSSGLLEVQQQQAGKKYYYLLPAGVRKVTPVEDSTSTKSPAIATLKATPVVPSSAKSPVIPTSKTTPVIPMSKTEHVILPSKSAPAIPTSTKSPVILTSKNTAVNPSKNKYVVPASKTTSVNFTSKVTLVIPSSNCTPVTPTSQNTSLIPTSENTTVKPTSKDKSVFSTSTNSPVVPTLARTPVVSAPTIAQTVSKLDSHLSSMDTKEYHSK